MTAQEIRFREAYQRWAATFHLVDGIVSPDALPRFKIPEREDAWAEYCAARDELESQNFNRC